MIFGKNIRKSARELALQTPEEEVCGLIIFNNNDLKIIKCKNNANNKKETFSLNTKDYLRCSLTGEIVGVFHSHPEGTTNLSLYDKINCNGHNLKFLIYSIKEDAFGEHEPNGYVSPYIGREFIWGKQDCLSLIIDYYNRELGLNIENLFFDRNSNIFETLSKGWLYEQNEKIYKKYNFIKISDKITQNTILNKNDLLLIKKENKNFPEHAAVYIGGGKILHQPRNHYSLIDNINNEKIIQVLRQKC